MNFQPPDPNGFGHCLKCHCGIEESEQRGGICIDCQITAAGNEPAFPVGANEYGGHGTVFGVTVRDFFAAKAMSGFCASESMIDSNDSRAIAYVADVAYAMADAMLAARIK